jgi:CubicO group peptidase (beta-lactamase class C family)
MTITDQLWPIIAAFNQPIMASLSTRLNALSQTIEELMSIAGTPGASIGVYRLGEPEYFANFGYRDVEAKLPIIERTIFPACSLTKLFTSMALGEAIESGTYNIGWESKVTDILPEFEIEDPMLRTMTITDCLSHRTGMSRGNLYLGSGNNMLIAHRDSLKFISDQVPIIPLRQEFDYNNLGFELAGLVLDKVTGSSWAELCRTSFFCPWDMTRTSIGRPMSGDGLAKAYNVMDNATAVEIPTVQAGEGTFGGSSAGLFTTTEDLLKAYSHVLEAINQFSAGATNSEESKIKGASTLFSAKIPMAQPTYGEASYALGLARLQLPGKMGYIGINPKLLPDAEVPVLAKGTPSRLVFYHQGSFPGALSAITLIPELQTVTVVMTNALALNDCPDWINQLILEEILEAPVRNDYISVAKKSAAKTLEWYPDTLRDLESLKKPGTASRPLEAFVGTYWNKKKYFRVDVELHDGELSWVLQGLESERYTLEHYEDDVFHWLKPRNYLAARGRWVDEPAIFWKLRFAADQSGDIFSLNWAHDSDVENGETFYRL